MQIQIPQTLICRQKRKIWAQQICCRCWRKLPVVMFGQRTSGLWAPGKDLVISPNVMEAECPFQLVVWCSMERNMITPQVASDRDPLLGHILGWVEVDSSRVTSAARFLDLICDQGQISQYLVQWSQICSSPVVAKLQLPTRPESSRLWSWWK